MSTFEGDLVLRAMAWLYLAIGAGVAALAWWLPRFSRPDLYFAVTVDPGYPASPEGRAAHALYRRWVAATALPALAATAVAVVALAPLTALIVVPGLVVLLVIGMMVGYLAARRRVLPAARAPRVELAAASFAGGDEKLPGGWLGQSGPFLLLAAAGLWLALAWGSIPERFPVHYDAAFRPDRWAERTPGGVFLPLLFGALMVAVLWLLQWGMMRRVRQVAVGGEAAVHERARRRASAGGVLGAVYLMAAIAATLALAPLFQGDSGTAQGWLYVTLGLTMVGTLLLLAWVALRLVPLFGHRALETAPAGAGPLGDRTADANWKWGVVYYNPADPAVFIEKRFGIGYTVNAARPAVWIVLLVLLAAPLLLALAL